MDLMLLRHAKSSWKNSDLSDHQRPLNDRGIRDKRKMADWLNTQSVGDSQYKLVSSDAKRTRQTSKAFINALNITEVSYESHLYHASTFQLEEVISEHLADNFITLIVGHNPGLTEALNKVPDFSLDNLPTCGMVALHYPGDEQDFRFNSCTFKWMQYPKAL